MGCSRFGKIYSDKSAREIIAPSAICSYRRFYIMFKKMLCIVQVNRCFIMQLKHGNLDLLFLPYIIGLAASA